MGEPALKKQKVSKPVLHSYWRSSCSWRVCIALNMKNIDYEYKAVHLLNDGGEQLKDDFAAKNPSKELPCLEIDGMNLAQSMAIISYLEETVDGGEALFPKDPKLRYKMRRLCDIIGTGIQPIQNLRVLKYCMAKVDGKDAKTKVKLDWGRYWIDLGFQALETALQDSAGKYCVGDRVTCADLFLVPQVYNANRFGVDMAKFPTIARIEKSLSELPAFKKAHPSAQPDAQ